MLVGPGVVTTRTSSLPTRVPRESENDDITLRGKLDFTKLRDRRVNVEDFSRSEILGSD